MLMISTVQIQIKNIIETSNLESSVLLPKAFKLTLNIFLEDMVDLPGISYRFDGAILGEVSMVYRGSNQIIIFSVFNIHNLS